MVPSEAHLIHVITPQWTDFIQVKSIILFVIVLLLNQHKRTNELHGYIYFKIIEFVHIKQY